MTAVMNSGVASVNDGNGHSVSFAPVGGREGFTVPDGGFYGFEGTFAWKGYIPNKIYLPGDSTNAALGL